MRRLLTLAAFGMFAVVLAACDDVAVDGGNGDVAMTFSVDGDMTISETSCDTVDRGVCEAAYRYLLALRQPSNVCTMQHGGPETARMEGTLDGESFSVELHKRNGCAIDAWDNLESFSRRWLWPFG